MAAPQPDAIWNGMANWYSSTIAAYNVPVAHTLLLHMGDLTKEDLVILETHNGDGRTAELVLKLYPSVSYQGCDFSSEMNKLCSARISSIPVKNPPKIFTANSMELPTESSTIDVYICNFGGCCVAEFSALLKEALRVLKSGGSIGLSLRNEAHSDDSYFRLIAEALQPHGYPPYPQREGLWIGHDPAKLRDKLEQAGFKDVLAWKTAVVLPPRSADELMALALASPAVAGCLGKLDAAARATAEAALREAAGKAAAAGGFQVSTGCVVARKP